MAGDNLEFDIMGAQRLGLRGAWLDRPGLGVPADSAVRPDRIVRSLDELLAVLTSSLKP
jgi:putative hydrolase of the HAD superfamily